jgi:hypothetical protein
MAIFFFSREKEAKRAFLFSAFHAKRSRIILLLFLSDFVRNHLARISVNQYHGS